MSRAMVRWTVAGALAVGGAAAMGGFGPDVAKAEAAPTKTASPFAGAYKTVSVPGQAVWAPDWTVAVSDDGTISGSISTFIDFTHYYYGSISGRVRSDGALTITLTQQYAWGFPGDPDYVTSGRSADKVRETGSLSIDSAGNLTGFGSTWYRQ